MKKVQRDNSIGYLIWKLSNAARAYLEVYLREIDVTVSQMGALDSLHAEPLCSTADLARELNMTPQNLSLVVNKLEGEGHVERHPHETNRRVQKLVLTTEGQKTMERAIERALRVDARLTADLSASERATLTKLLQRCLHTVDLAELRLGARPERQKKTKKRTAHAGRTKKG